MTLIDDLASEALVADSYERVKADLAAVPVEQLLQLNVDVQSAARIILGSLPEIKKLRDRIVKELPSVDIQTFDKLEDYAQALKYAQANQQLASEPQDDGPELETMGKELRDRMIADAQALALYKLFDGQLLDRLKGGNGINNLAEDLELLSQAMLNSWSKIQGKALTPLEDVHTASRIGLRLTRIIGLREQGPERLAEATELRLRAFTVLLNTYEEARNSIRFLRRREDDLESIAPTLYPGTARRKSGPTDATPAVGVPGTVTATTPAAPTTPTTGAAAPSAPVPAHAAAAPLSTGASRDPFMS